MGWWRWICQWLAPMSLEDAGATSAAAARAELEPPDDANAPAAADGLAEEDEELMG